MPHQDKKLELLRNRIQSDLNVEPENLDDLVNFVTELLKKGTKDRLASELKEIYEGSSNVDSFVEWVWNVFGQEHKSAETPKKDLETSKSKEIEKKQPNKNIGVAHLAAKAFNDVKGRDKEEPNGNGNNTRKPLDRNTVTRFKMNQNKTIDLPSRQEDEEKMRSSGRDSKPIIKLKGDHHSVQPVEERKTGSILDRVIKAGDKNKRPLPTAREEAKVDNKYEKIEKKIKPDPVSTSAPPTTTKPKRTIKTAAQVRAEEEMARAQASAQAVMEPDAIEDKGPTMEMQKSHSEAPAKLKIRCRNWPNCKNEECLYHHPTENCKFFPSCPYGEKCLYIHPAIPCKFKEFCQRPGCSYVHPRPTGGNAGGYYGFGGQQPIKKKPFGGNYKFAPKAQNMEGQGGPSNEVES